MLNKNLGALENASGGVTILHTESAHKNESVALNKSSPRSLAVAKAIIAQGFAISQLL